LCCCLYAVLLLLCCTDICVALLLFVLSYVLIVCTVPLPPGINPIPVDKYININIITHTIRFMDNVSSLNKVSQQTKRIYRFLDLCSPTFLKGKLPPRSIKEGRKVAKSKKTANGMLSDVDPRIFQAILYFQNVASCDGSPLNLSSFWGKGK